MSNQIIVPSLGESVTEATVSKWLKQVGENVDTDEPLVELETDKVNIEVPSPSSGTLSSIKVKEGDTVEVGSLLGLVSEGRSLNDKAKEKNGEDQKPYIPPKIKKQKLDTKKIKKQESLKLIEETKEENLDQALVLDTLAEVDEENKETEKIKYIPPKTKKHLAPSVRKIVEENDIDIDEVVGTGKAGRISKGDLINLMGNILFVYTATMKQKEQRVWVVV